MNYVHASANQAYGYVAHSFESIIGLPNRPFGKSTGAETAFLRDNWGDLLS